MAASPGASLRKNSFASHVATGKYPQDTQYTISTSTLPCSAPGIFLLVGANRMVAVYPIVDMSATCARAAYRTWMEYGDSRYYGSGDPYRCLVSVLVLAKDIHGDQRAGFHLLLMFYRTKNGDGVAVLHRA